MFRGFKPHHQEASSKDTRMMVHNIYYEEDIL